MSTAIVSEKTYRVLGYTEHHTSCDCCGRQELKGTVAMESSEGDGIFYFGVVCAAKISKSTTKRIQDILTETEKQNLINARNEFRASSEYIADENYMNETNKIFETLIDFNTRLPYINERMRLGRIADKKKAEIAAKYFIKYTHKF